jgi:NAD(P)-dependent dehydrogenase (short-subunit alcohol dehydrogenase family)
MYDLSHRLHWCRFTRRGKRIAEMLAASGAQVVVADPSGSGGRASAAARAGAEANGAPWT